MPRRPHNYSKYTNFYDEIKEPRYQFNINVAAAVLFTIFACFAIFLVTESMRVNEHRGCTASAYQATQNGFDLEANLAVCQKTIDTLLPGDVSK